jgi:hypothetical protein
MWHLVLFSQTICWVGVILYVTQNCDVLSEEEWQITGLLPFCLPASQISSTTCVLFSNFTFSLFTTRIDVSFQTGF